MAGKESPLLARNPLEFMNIVRMDDREARLRALPTADDLVACEILRHGLSERPDELPALAALYQDYFLPAPVDRRTNVYGHVKGFVAALGGQVAPAFLPFMLLDPDAAIVSTAVVDYCSLAHLVGGDAMSSPKSVVAMILRGVPENPAAVFGGLLALGDPRVCALIEPLRDIWDTAGVATISICYTGLSYKCCIDFYLGWLDGLVERDDDDGLAAFGNVAAGLYRMANSRIPNIIDGERPFPYRMEDAGSQYLIDREQYVASIAERLLIWSIAKAHRKSCRPSSKLLA